MDLETFLVHLYVLVDEWWERAHTPAPTRPGRPPSLSPSEVLTLAVLPQWPRFLRSERDSFRFADAHLRSYSPNLLSQSQLNRRIRALEPELRALQKDLASLLSDGSEVYRVLDTTLIPAIVRARACRKGLFAGQATFGRSVSKTEWVYGSKVALSVTPAKLGIVTAFGLAPANCNERPVGEFLVCSDADADAGPMERFESMWTRVIESLETHRPLWVASFEAFVQTQHSPELREQLADGQEEGRYGLAAMFQKIEESAVDERTARTVGSFYLALLNGLMVQWLLDPERAPSGSDMAEALREILASVRSAEEAGDERD